jgi:endonuclease/exonuclease/phosphatase family metal-dependent hydrolase
MRARAVRGEPWVTPASTAHRLSDHARTIDWIFVSDTADSQGRVHNDIRASDHYPVSATLTRPRAFSC